MHFLLHGHQGLQQFSTLLDCQEVIYNAGDIYMYFSCIMQQHHSIVCNATLTPLILIGAAELSRCRNYKQPCGWVLGQRMREKGTYRCSWDETFKFRVHYGCQAEAVSPSSIPLFLRRYLAPHMCLLYSHPHSTYILLRNEKK